MAYKTPKFLHHPSTAWIILFSSLCVTALAWYISTQFVKQRQLDKFKFRTEEIDHAISQRMLEYEHVLWSGIGLFSSSEHVSREEWNIFVKYLQLDEYYPGIQGIGFSKFLTPDELAEHEAQVQAEGFPDYHVKPEGERPLYSSIVYLEPFDIRNQRAFGYDMYSQPTRRSAMDTARDTGRAAISGMVTLVQEMDTDIQKGFLFYLPLYKNGTENDTVAQRRENIIGYVYSPFRMGDLMRGVLGIGESDVEFSIYDGNLISDETLMYHSDEMEAVQAAFPSDCPYQHTQTLELPGGHVWTLHILGNPKAYGTSEENQPLIVAVGGVIIDTLLFLIIASISRQNRRAQTLARQMTNELRDTTTRFKLAVESANIGIWVYNIRSNELSWDDQMFALYGVSRDQFSGEYQVWENGLHPDDKERTVQALNDSIAGKCKFAPIFRVVHPNGKIRILKADAYVERDESGNAIRMVGLNTDITEQRKAAEQLEIRNRAIESAPYGVIITDVANDNRIIYVNPAFEKITGYTKEEAKGQNCRFLSQHNHDQPGITELREAVKSHKPCNTIVENKRKDGSLFWNRLSISPVQDEFGKTIHFVGIQEDITHQKKQEAQLKATMHEAQLMSKQAQAANRAKSAFLATMSHEIRTPMNAVIGMATLLRNTPLNQEQQDYLDTLDSSGNSLLALINDILDFSKIEAGEINLERLSFNLKECVNSSIEILASEANKKNLDLKCTYAPDVPATLSGDPTRIRQILLNLVGNAIKFTESGSVHIYINTKQREDGKYIVTCEITDTGIGLTLQAQRRLFKPFYQADNSITRRYGGTGLGLAISRKLALAMEGEITVSSQPGEGSTFRLQIVLAPGTEETTKPGNGFQPDKQELNYILTKDFASRHPLDILVVEDNPINRRVIEQILSKLGYQPDSAHNGQEAVTKAQQKNYQLILMDVQMPIMSGIDATKAILETSDEHARPYIAALTANAKTEDQKTCTEAGMNAFIPKPVKVHILKDLLASLSNKAPAQPSNQQATHGKTQQNGLLNHEHLDNLAALSEPDDEPTLIEGMLEGIEEQFDSILDSLRQAQEQKNQKQIRQALHTLRGVSANLGFQAMHELAEQASEVIKEKNENPPDTLAEDLKKLFHRSMEALHSEGYIKTIT